MINESQVSQRRILEDPTATCFFPGMCVFTIITVFIYLVILCRFEFADVAESIRICVAGYRSQDNFASKQRIINLRLSKPQVNNTRSK